jgi:hypothetical protein
MIHMHFDHPASIGFRWESNAPMHFDRVEMADLRILSGTRPVSSRFPEGQSVQCLVVF